MVEKVCHLKLGKNMSFKIEDESQPIYDDKYIKAEVKTFNSMINTLFSGDEIPEERSNYICIVAIVLILY